MAKQITITAYTFDELSDKAKDKAREWMRRCVGEDYGWADFIESDAAEVGLKITGWNLDQGAYCKLEAAFTPNRVSELILEHHGEGCDTRKAAEDYRTSLLAIQRKADNGDTNMEEEEDATAQAEQEFLNALQGCYLQMLRAEWEYRLSDEGIDEDIHANEYLFTEDGSRTTIL